MSTTAHTTADEPTTDYTLRFEVLATWDRELTHPKDDPERLEERLQRIPVDGDVTVTDMGPTRAALVVETTAEEMDHSPGVFASKVRHVFRAYSARTLAADDIPSAPRSPPELKRKHIRWAAEGKDRPTGSRRVPKEAWEVAESMAEGLDLEGAERVEPTITTRTLAGAADAHE